MGCADPSSGFINLRETETDGQQLVLLAYGPGTREGESFPQSQHSFKPPDCSSCCMEGLKAADSRHVLFGPEMIALNPLLQVLAGLVVTFVPKVPIWTRIPRMKPGF